MSVELVDMRNPAQLLSSVERALVTVNKEAQLSDLRARYEVAKKARTQTVREAKAVFGLPTQRPFRRRLKAFRGNLRGKPVQLWSGLKYSITSKEVPSLAKESETFEATMPSGHVGRFARSSRPAKNVKGYRRLGGSRKPQNRFVRPDGQTTELPIESPRISLYPKIGPIMERAADEAMRTGYARFWRRDFNFRIRRSLRRR